MKNILSFIMIFSAGLLAAQECNTTAHSDNENDGWLSCSMSQSPNLERANAYWLMYDLGHVYSLSATQFWNYNKKSETENGIKNVIIDISTDGNTWTEAATFQLDQAVGSSSYEGQAGPDLENAKARYILLSSTDTWGRECAGLSEVKFDIGDLSTALYDLYADESGISLYPNPTNGLFVIKGELDNYNVKILDVNGTVVQNLSNVPSEISIDISALPDGLYFISVYHRENNLMSIEKILKQSQ